MVWRGLGFYVFGIVFLTSLVAETLTIATFDKHYWEIHSWPFGLAMIVAGGLIWITDKVLSKRPVRHLVDEKSGERITLGEKHDFFFISMKWWSFIVAAFGLAFIVAGWTPSTF